MQCLTLGETSQKIKSTNSRASLTKYFKVLWTRCDRCNITPEQNSPRSRFWSIHLPSPTCPFFELPLQGRGCATHFLPGLDFVDISPTTFVGAVPMAVPWQHKQRQSKAAEVPSSPPASYEAPHGEAGASWRRRGTVQRVGMAGKPTSKTKPKQEFCDVSWEDKFPTSFLKNQPDQQCGKANHLEYLRARTFHHSSFQWVDLESLPNAFSWSFEDCWCVELAAISVLQGQRNGKLEVRTQYF